MSAKLTIPNLEIQTTDLPLRTLIDKVRTGEICLPLFQRDFVWDDKQVRDLFESIIYNHPIGVIILWQPPRELLESDKIPYICFDDEVKPKDLPTYLVLDGNQRLTSLFLAVKGWKIRRNNRDIEVSPTCIYSQGTRIDLTVCREKGQEKCEICIDDLIKAFGLYDTKVMLKLAQQYKSEYIEELRKIAQAVLEYRVPVYYYITKSASEDIAVAIAESFIRINKTGTRIGNVELLVSLAISILTSKKVVDIGNLIWNKFNEARHKYGIDPVTYHRLLIKLIGLKQTDVARIPLRSLKKLEERIERADGKEFSEKLGMLEVAIDTLYQFFNKVLSLKSFEDLPSHTALVPVIYYAYVKCSKGLKIEEVEFLKLLSWYILASLRGVFSGSGVDSRLEKALVSAEEGIDSMFDFLAKTLKQQKEEVRISKEELVRVFRGRGRGVVSDAAKFLLKALLTLNNADDWSGKVINFAHKELELHHIFPRSTDERTDSVANLTFISSVINKSIQNKHPHEYIFNELKLSPKVLEEHFMPVEKEYYTDFEKFISERASIIVSKGKKLLPDLFR
jgi:hypothetical protein